MSGKERKITKGKDMSGKAAVDRLVNIISQIFLCDILPGTDTSTRVCATDPLLTTRKFLILKSNTQSYTRSIQKRESVWPKTVDFPDLTGLYIVRREIKTIIIIIPGLFRYNQRFRHRS